MHVPWLVGFVVGSMAPGLLVTWAAAFAVRRAAAAWGLVDQPHARKVHVHATPLGGGLAIWLGVVTTFAAGQLALGWSLSGLWPLPPVVQPHLPGLQATAPQLWTVLGLATVLLGLGLLDDRFGLPWPLRLVIQAGVAAAAVYGADCRLTLFLPVPLVTDLLSIVWIVGLVNAFNMLDNMDALSAGVAAIAAALFALLMLAAPGLQAGGPQLFVAGFLLVLVGSLLGFLWHNRPPARLFMGDAGSYFIGFCLAVATLRATFAGYGHGQQLAVLAPLCVLAVPLYDMASVILIRLGSGRSPFQADTNHFSHRLVQLGLTPGQAVLTIYLLTATCGLGAVLLHRLDMLGAWLVVAMVVLVLVLVAILEHAGRRGRGP